jgi:endonuclease YncB( thermonuclease family)
MRKAIITTAFASIALAAAAPAHAATAVCVVADPTGTPLNIRLQPNGETVASVRNGEKLLVFFEGAKTDSRGRVWYEVAMSTSAAPDGYVFAEFVRCP